LPIFFLQHRPDRSHVFGDVAEQRHGSCDVSVLDRPLDVPIVALILRLDKCRFRTFSIGISASSSAASTPVASPRLAGAHFANRNDFWRLLNAAGFTSRLYEPHEQYDALAEGIGITNAALRTTRGSGTCAVRTSRRPPHGLGESQPI
jgi:hypothetical protein